MAYKYKGNLFYCPFCKCDVEKPTPIRYKGSGGRTSRNMFLCPTCGGHVVTGARAASGNRDCSGVKRIHK